MPAISQGQAISKHPPYCPAPSTGLPNSPDKLSLCTITPRANHCPTIAPHHHPLPQPTRFVAPPPDFIAPKAKIYGFLPSSTEIPPKYSQNSTKVLRLVNWPMDIFFLAKQSGTIQVSRNGFHCIFLPEPFQACEGPKCQRKKT